VLQATFGKISFVGLKKKTNLNVKSEEWTFFDACNKYHHQEQFLHEYDQEGRRIKGQLINHGRDIRYDMYYQYDENGMEITQLWKNTVNPEDVYHVTNHFNEYGNLIIGGKGIGNEVSWEYQYDYDQSGRKIRMTNTYSNGNSWVFDYHHDDEGKLILGEGKAANGLVCTIVYRY
jgi:YD repeat-containing protein